MTVSKMSNVLLLSINSRIKFYSLLKEYADCDVSYVYKPITNKALLFLRRLHLKSKLPFYHVWYENLNNKLRGHDTVILFDSPLNVPVVYYIKRNYPNIRIIFWFWNHIYKPDILNLLPENLCEKWSYDPEDCAMYGLKFNTQFNFQKLCNDGLKDTQNKFPIKYDAFFIGTDKLRESLLERYKNQIEKCGLLSRFQILKYGERNPRGSMTYEEVIKTDLESRAIIDIVPETQKGLTLRPLESIFLKRKLITNYKSIVSCDFYNPNNVFILDVDDLTNLKNFVHSPYSEIPFEIVNNYDINQWLNRFD